MTQSISEVAIHSIYKLFRSDGPAVLAEKTAAAPPRDSGVKRAQGLVLLKDRPGGQQTAHYEAMDTEWIPHMDRMPETLP